jgi:hypothetical protein
MAEEIVLETKRVELSSGTFASDYSLRNLNKALGEAQIEFLPAEKEAENKYSNYKYTPLVAIVGAVRPSLVKHHLTVSQFTEADLSSKTVKVYTRIVHWDSGEWMQNELELPAELALGKGGVAVFNQQTIGGSQTYAQKYAYKAIVGIPDSEEIIDSTEEKGDLPARGKTFQRKVDTPAQAEQQAKAQIDAARARTNTRPAEAHEADFRIIGDRLTVPVVAVEKKHSDKKNSDYLVVWPDGTVNGTDRLYVWDSKLFPHLVGKAQKQTCSFNIEQKKFTTTNGKEINSIIITGVDTVGEDVIEQTNCAPATEDYANSDVPF